MSKKILLVLLVISGAVVLGALIFLGWQWWQKNSVEQPLAEESLLPQITCDFVNDEVAADQAKQEKKIEFCVCVKDYAAQFQCKEAVANQNYFDQARQQFDASLCDHIVDVLLQQSCRATVASGIEYLKEKDLAYLADVYSQNNNYDEAINLLVGAKETETDAKLMLSLALNYADKGLMEHKEGEYIPKAEELVNKALSLEPDSAEAYRVQGYIYEVKPDLFKSVESYNKSLEKDSNYVLSLVGRGHAYNLMGDLYKALEDFQKAAELDKDKQYMFIYANLCRLQTSRDDLLADGIKNCQIVIASAAVGAELKSDTYQILADVYVWEKKFNEALAQLENARAFSPQNVNLFVSFASLYNEKEDYAKAIEESQKALAIDSLKTAAYRALAYAYLKTQDYTQAETQALRGLEVVENDPSLLVPSKPYFIQQLNYILADIFAAKGDKEKEAQYKTAGDNAMKTQ
ncbi:tetratricopeptide repeat protein [Patescibacteria group bacterium]|nr:tetratricopeptide repeat protein [Patescibacteria group bacterium]MBU2220071.1 tetratricopeptide repeat protein [Patescibacteria group bacterium]MBU2264703.1 tetratricopeptide repeat protein [Patescibacteria group bacterium]